MTAPKVFVSHASEDKLRFVVGFAQRLRGLFQVTDHVEAFVAALKRTKPPVSRVG